MVGEMAKTLECLTALTKPEIEVHQVERENVLRFAVYPPVVQTNFGFPSDRVMSNTVDLYYVDQAFALEK